ncbi:EamA/RhaT family transporter [Mycetocola manganoxydans]|uniref:EamA/RhaT family transporter n=1 Tax=Mycetocola manganoxydans TaxID=699879 RepID=A0A3L6ZWB1_9MICO|nr:DMT family transporter [Mycetocola manganoxydans]RLP72044.1 EamA/RhaT family transporter [Mycetocola manganoxydans]GHD47675.1 membrane protein [Mycetocola manganoxydans]
MTTALTDTDAVRPASRTQAAGIVVALVSAFTFALSGPFAKALMDAGWSPGAAVLARVGGAALVLLIPTLWMMRGRWRTLRTSGSTIALYGAVAIAGAQVGFFNAVSYMSVGVALLIEYLAPVLLVLLVWAQTRRRPGIRTILGTILAVVGMVFVLDLTGAQTVHPLGVAWALLAALSLATYFVLGTRISDDLPPLVLAGGGLVIGTIVVAICGVIGLLPMQFSTADVTMIGIRTSWLVPILALALISTVAAYVTGIVATARLGTRIASFVGLSEVVFAVLASWLLLAELPGPLQLVGGVGILAGVILVRADRYAPGS